MLRSCHRVFARTLQTCANVRHLREPLMTPSCWRVRRGYWLHSLCLPVLCACAVDDRILSTEWPPPPRTVTFDAGHRDAETADAQLSTDSGPPESPQEAGTGGAPSQDAASELDADQPELPLDECDRPDQQLQIANATFDRNELDWDPDGNAAKQWSEEDANGSGNSGSIVVRNKEVETGTGLSSGGVSQCVEIPRDVGYQVCVDYLLGNAGSSAAAASVRVTLFDGETCSGSVSSSPSIPTQNDTGGWTAFKHRIPAPPQTSSFKSMLIKLAAVKSKEDAPLEIQFDNVRIGTVP